MYGIVSRPSEDVNRLKLFTDGLDLKQIVLANGKTILEQFKFPYTTTIIDLIIDAKEKPENIIPSENFFDFVRQTHDWLKWFDSFIDIFRPIIEWLKIQNVDNAELILSHIVSIIYKFVFRLCLVTQVIIL
ncbi:unnamed protein product, partial [Didymodactylos carnosus]